MRQVNDQVLSATDTTTKTVNGSTLDFNQIINSSFHCVISDVTAAATFKLQASNDVYQVGQQPGTFVPTNWVDIPNKTVNITAGTKQGLLEIQNGSYRWVRAVVVITTLGSGTVVVNRFAMGT